MTIPCRIIAGIESEHKTLLTALEAYLKSA
jgi:hypothetical protein